MGDTKRGSRQRLKHTEYFLLRKEIEADFSDTGYTKMGWKELAEHYQEVFPDVPISEYSIQDIFRECGFETTKARATTITRHEYETLRDRVHYLEEKVRELSNGR